MPGNLLRHTLRVPSIGRPWPFEGGPGRGYVAALPALALGALGFAVFLWIYGVTSRVCG